MCELLLLSYILLYYWDNVYLNLDTRSYFTTGKIIYKVGYTSKYTDGQIICE